MRHSCWGFIESACMKTSLPDAGNTLYTVRGTAGVGRPRAAREPGPASRPPRSGPPPRSPARPTESRLSKSLCFTLSTETVD